VAVVEKNINSLYHLIKSNFNPYKFLLLKQRLIQSFTILLLFSISCFLVGCGIDGDESDDEGFCDLANLDLSGCIAEELAEEECCRAFCVLIDSEGIEVGTDLIPPIRQLCVLNSGCVALDCQTLDCGGFGFIFDLERTDPGEEIDLIGKIIRDQEEFSYECSSFICGCGGGF